MSREQHGSVSAMRAANGYGPVPSCGPGCLPRAGSVPQVAVAVRALRVTALAVVLLAGIGVALTQPLLRSGGRAWCRRAWFRALLLAAGVRLVVESARLVRPAGRGVLVAANHISWLDVPALLAVEPMRVVAKADLRRWPIVGRLAAGGGTIFIDRDRLRRLPSTVAEVADALRRGEDVLVFPEATTRCGRTQGRIYPAMFQAAINASAPVRPVTVRYRLAGGRFTTVAAFVGPDTLLASVLRVVATRGLVVEIAAGPVARTSGASRRVLAAEIDARIAHDRHPIRRGQEAAPGPRLHTPHATADRR